MRKRKRAPNERSERARRWGRKSGAAALVTLLALSVPHLIAGAQGAERDAARDDAAAVGEVEPEVGEVDGWFTVDQAHRGRGAYAEHCAECHSADLRARGAYISLYRYPSLKGAYFWDRWGGETVHTLQLVIQETMPLDAPNSLDANTYADITAHILDTNGFPAGSDELPAVAADPNRLLSLAIEPAFARPLAQAQRVGADRPMPPSSDPPSPPPAPTSETEPPTFRAEQPERARDLFADHCARCHGPALRGIGVAPSLAGANFLERWGGERVSDLFWVVDALMPLDDAEAIQGQDAADLVAFILAENGFDAGDEALPPDEAALTRYVIEGEPNR
jgi:cytochrome c